MNKLISIAWMLSFVGVQAQTQLASGTGSMPQPESVQIPYQYGTILSGVYGNKSIPEESRETIEFIPPNRYIYKRPSGGGSTGTWEAMPPSKNKGEKCRIRFNREGNYGDIPPWIGVDEKEGLYGNWAFNSGPSSPQEQARTIAKIKQRYAGPPFFGTYCLSNRPQKTRIWILPPNRYYYATQFGQTAGTWEIITQSSGSGYKIVFNPIKDESRIRLSRTWQFIVEDNVFKDTYGGKWVIYKFPGS